ncbi:MAG: TonB-dependent receptor [Halieaceae bacterium]
MNIRISQACLLASLFGTTALANEVEEVVVSGQRDSRTIDVIESLSVAPDAAQLLREAPGANVNSNGPITAIPQYRGMFGPRIAVSLNGSMLAPAGPNWMDPPLSYAMTAQLESLEIYRGIAPVSVAQESLGGAIDAQTRRGEFADSDDFVFSGRVMGSAQSVSNAYQGDAEFLASNRQHRLKVAAMTQEGDDAEFPDGDIVPTEYTRQRYDIGYGFRTGEHTVQLDYGYHDAGDSGTPALPMDIEYIEGDLYNLGYTYEGSEALSLAFALFGSELDHGMTNYHLRAAPTEDRWRRNIADSSNFGFSAEATWTDEKGSWRAGVDGFDERHDSDIDNPRMPAFFVVNFNKAERQVLGAYLERDMQAGDDWQLHLGLRYNYVSADSGEVDGTPAMMMPPAQALRDAFNAADRSQTDHNLDMVLQLRYDISPGLQAYAGVAQKNRSASYQERYLWLPLEATGGLADGQLYIGNIGLDPETASQLEFGFDLSYASVSLAPRLFYNRVDDYIQGTPLASSSPAFMMNAMMNPTRSAPLQFNNVDAELYGFDMDWRWQLGDNWSLSGLVNYVRGERRDIDDNLYRIAPPNASVRLNYNATNWGVSVENVLYASQDDVSETNREKESAGYGLVNLAGTWQLSPALQLAAGVDNTFDKLYEDHLGGYNRVMNADVEQGSRLPGLGRNVFARVVYTF